MLNNIKEKIVKKIENKNKKIRNEFYNSYINTLKENTTLRVENLLLKSEKKIKGFIRGLVK